MKTLLITGFDPFGGQEINPAWEAVQCLPDTVGDYQICKLQIPTIFRKAPETVLEKAQALHPDVIISIGQASGRTAVTPERVGINMMSATMADNAGVMPVEESIVPGGPDGIFATVPVYAMAQAITAAGLPGMVSNTAGTFVCNNVLYTLLHHFAGTGTRVGFIHVPNLPQQGEPSLSLEKTVQALEAALSVL